MSIIETREARLALALLLGLLLGVERERRKRARGSIAGLRTFALVGLLGGLAAYIELPFAVVAGGLIIGALVVVGYALDAQRSRDPGLTTEVALVVTYGLGALAIREPLVATGATIASALLLHLRSALHRFVREGLRDDEVHDVLLLLVFGFVALGLAPDVDVGPYRAINPQALARLAFLVTLISSAGYVAQRIWGARLGLVASGLASGLVSSSATIAALGLRAKGDLSIASAAAAGAVASSVATILQYALLLSALDPALLALLGLPLGCALLAAVTGTLVLARLSRESAEPDAATHGRAFQLLPALVLAGASAVLAVLSAALGDRIGDAGIVMISSAAGFIDAHATTGAVASLHRGGQVDAALATLALLAALTTNTVTKIVMAGLSGPRPYALRVTCGVLAIAAAAWVGFAL